MKRMFSGGSLAYLEKEGDLDPEDVTSKTSKRLSVQMHANITLKRLGWWRWLIVRWMQSRKRVKILTGVAIFALLCLIAFVGVYGSYIRFLSMLNRSNLSSKVPPPLYLSVAFKIYAVIFMASTDHSRWCGHYWGIRNITGWQERFKQWWNCGCGN